MLINGNAIALDIQQSLKDRLNGRRLALAIVQVGSDAASTKFVQKKRAFGAAIGIDVETRSFVDSVTEETLTQAIRDLADDSDVHGIVVQLPLPKHINPDSMLNLVPKEKDPDALSSGPLVLPPVAGAVAEILKRSNVDVREKKAVVVGRGRLVGIPVAEWFRNSGAGVQVIGRDVEDISTITWEADVIVTGAGVPHLITPDMIRDGVVLIDAGTSEQAGALVGDIDPQCAEKASVYTPVPGGVGPITVAKLFENLVALQA